MIKFYQSELLKQLEVEKYYSLEEIDEAIDELENKINKVVFGNRFYQDLELLYIFKERKEKQIKYLECNKLKTEMQRLYCQSLSDKEARVKTFAVWVEIRNEGFGIDYELEELIKAVAKIRHEQIA